MPPVPFWWAVRPNSLIVTSVMFSASSPMSCQKAADAVGEVAETVGELAGGGALVLVGVPAADVGEGGFDAEVGFHELGDSGLRELPKVPFGDRRRRRAGW